MGRGSGNGVVGGTGMVALAPTHGNGSGICISRDNPKVYVHRCAGWNHRE